MMKDIDEAQLQDSLDKVKSKCRAILVICVILAVIYAAIWIGTTTLSFLDDSLSAGSSVYALLYGALFLAILITLANIFRDVVKVGALFSVAQANRLRLIAVFALALVLVDLVFDATAAYQVSALAGTAFDINGGESANTIDLNVSMLVFSGIMYSLSAIFRYAALLQQLSDDTV